MREWDIVDDLIDLGKRCGTLTYDEIIDCFPSEFVSPGELADFMDLLQDMGIKVIDKQEHITDEEENLEEEEYEKKEDLIQTYFHSMGNITILTRNEEIEIAKRLEEGKEIMKEIVATLPLYHRLKAQLNDENEENLNNSEEVKTDEALEISLKVLENLMLKIDIAERKISRYGTLKDLNKLINYKKKHYIDHRRLNTIAKEVESCQ